MRERPIIFNAEMVRAILDGRKTQTRRLIDWRRTTRATEIAERDDGSMWPWSEDCENGGDAWWPCPFGAVGDRLWVRETWTHESVDAEEGSYYPDYRATANGQPVGGKWIPSIHMPRWASRITLEITGVRVERLASITEEDAGKEGYPADPYPFGGHMDKWLWFRQLWDGIYPEQSFKVNPWVWVVEFRRIGGDS